MSKEQSEIVKLVYNRFIESEDEIAWTDLDSNLELMGYLTDRELMKETQIKIFEHSKGIFRCGQSHSQENCMAPLILESAIAISDLYEKTKQLHGKNRYVLEYYLAMSEMNLIYVQF